MFPKPQQGLENFNKGQEVKRLGFSRPEESYYEVIDPRKNLARSLVTGEENELTGSYFLLIEECIRSLETVQFYDSRPTCTHW